MKHYAGLIFDYSHMTVFMLGRVRETLLKVYPSMARGAMKQARFRETLARHVLDGVLGVPVRHDALTFFFASATRLSMTTIRNAVVIS